MIKKNRIWALSHIILAGAVFYGAIKYSNPEGRFLVVASIWFLLLAPVSTFFRISLQEYIFSAYFQNQEVDSIKKRMLVMAGRYIGYCERTLILIFYCVDSLTAIAFLATAKSIYDYNTSHFSEDGDTEQEGGPNESGSSSNGKFEAPPPHYFVLGSLLSYTIAILGGVIVDILCFALDFQPFVLDFPSP